MSSSSTSVAAAARFSLHHVPILGLFLALWVFVMINSLRQKKHHGLPVWPVFGMLLSLSPALFQTKPYELLSEVLCHQNGTIRFKGPRCTSLFGAITCDPRNLEYLQDQVFQFPQRSLFPRRRLRSFPGRHIQRRQR
ncbi:hypothetical protein ACFX13_040536 [Malus domestica]